MSTNYELRGILASLPKGTPERHWRLIVALGTITPDGDGWRNIGMKLLGEYARLGQPKLRQARDELAAAGRIEYKSVGAGRGVRWWWKILIPPAENVNPWGSPSDKVNPWGSRSSGKKVNLQEQEGEPAGPEGEPSGQKGEPPNSVTSHDAGAECSLGALGALKEGARDRTDRATTDQASRQPFFDSNDDQAARTGNGHAAARTVKRRSEDGDEKPPTDTCPYCGSRGTLDAWEHNDGCEATGPPFKIGTSWYWTPSGEAAF